MSGDQSDVNAQQVIRGQDSAPSSKSDKEQTKAFTDFVDKEGELSMKLRVYSPFNDYYDGQVFSVTALNDSGPFDILPKHHNFISLLTASELVVRTVKEGERRIRISGGIMHVKADQVVVFLDV
ncbi:MAG: hypothetical protein NVS1B10_00850 [Candidatus Saccharimonadales bacterium]